MSWAGRESERRSREEEQMRFIAEDAREFARRYPEADLAGLDASESFRRFCGSRYGREPLSDLYADYLEVAGGALPGRAGEKGKPGCTVYGQRRQRGL